MNNKKKSRLIMLGIMSVTLVVLVTISTSYALWFARIEQTGNNVVTTECLEMTFSDGDGIVMENIYPISDEKGMSGRPYTFTITNTCTTPAKYTVKVKTLDEHTMPAEVTKVVLDDLTPVVLSDLTTTDNINYALNEGYLLPSETKTLEFRMWIDESGTLANSSNKKIDVKIIVDYTAVSLDDVPKPLVTETITNLVGNDEVFNENGIRYQGTDPNNYVVLEEGGEVYRIIGVFDTVLADGTTTESLVKLIKEESIGNLAWNSENVNDWNELSLKTTLNSNFLNSTEDYTVNGLNNQKEMIADVMWNLGGTDAFLTAEGFYNAERGTTVYSGRPTTGTGKVGLMYPSDYMYAVKATDCVRTTNASYYDNTSTCHDNNWLYDGVSEWTLTPYSSQGYIVWYVYSDGNVNNNIASGVRAVRPTVYLNTTAAIIEGSGSAADPYLIN